MARNRWTDRSRLGVAVLVLATAAGCGAPDVAPDELPREPARASGTGPDLSDAQLWLSFEDDSLGYDGAREFPDAGDGPFAGRVVTARGGEVASVPGADGTGQAVQFPARCAAASGCERAMVEVPANSALDPGTRDFEYGALVWLAPDQTTSGSNILQKGRFGSEGGLWKLQVDNEQGRPSCVVGSGGEPLTVRSSVSVADSRWHLVTCRRGKDGLIIRVDDTVDRVGGSTGSVGNSLPIRIGSPGTSDTDDQFHGRLDDVFVLIDGG